MASTFAARVEVVVEAARRSGRDDDALVDTAAPDDDAGSPARALADSLGLTRDELDFVWSAVAHAVDPRVAAHLATTFGSEARRGVTIAHHAAMFGLPAERVRALVGLVDPRHPLRRYSLVEPAGDSGDVHAPWRCVPRVWGHFAGDDVVDPIVAACGGIVVPPWQAQLSPEQHAAIDQLARCLGTDGDDGDDDATVIVEGALNSGRRTAVALAAGKPVVTIDLARVAGDAAVHAVIALRREALLRGAVPVIANLDAIGDASLRAVHAALDDITGPLAVTTTAASAELRAHRRRVMRLTWPLPDVATRRAFWLGRLGDRVEPATLDIVAERFVLGAGDIAAAARAADRLASDRGAPAPVLADVVAGVQANLAERLGDVARRVPVRQAWTDLVLPADTMDDVRALIGRVRHAHAVLERWGFRRCLPRGSGVAALFSGPPGTGKTMVAGLVARELDLELYQIDLSRIVSKWVGETEKQLARVFDAAEAGHALLLFDEADALFAKRSSDVKSAVDRYANLEVNYLLQRVESFGGTVILTTNLDTSIDPALRRRLASHIVFAMPDLPERVRLWTEMLRDAPIAEDVDVDALADEFSAMTGANIRNAVLAAAFQAADAGVTLGMQHLRRGARSEYRAMGRVFGKDERRAGGMR